MHAKELTSWFDYCLAKLSSVVTTT